ncbi:hypothetical protein J6590_051990 [Homalodisca vitripennis]|nr:hypothetical protein J6590_051990 [Homalodisca vitripennis]
MAMEANHYPVLTVEGSGLRVSGYSYRYWPLVMPRESDWTANRSPPPHPVLPQLLSTSRRDVTAISYYTNTESYFTAHLHTLYFPNFCQLLGVK